MKVIHERCAGLDVHKETVVGCVRVIEGAEVRREVRRFATTTRGLLELADWQYWNSACRGPFFGGEQHAGRAVGAASCCLR